MGGAKRYPSMAACAGDGFRERLNPSYRTTAADLRAQLNLLNRIKLMLSVQSPLQKYSCSLLTQITHISRTVPSRWRGVSRSSRTRGGMRWTRVALLTKALGLRTAKSRGPDTPTLVSSSREAKLLGGDGGKQARSPGRARNRPLKPLRREGRMFR